MSIDDDPTWPESERDRCPRPAEPSELRMTSMSEIGPGLVVLSFPIPPPTDELDALTPAEREVARLAVQGLSNAEIGAARGTRLRTVANQMAAIFAKLDVGSRHELTARFGTTLECEVALRD